VGVPKKRKSHTRKTKRRSHLALKKTSVNICPDCGEPTLPHRVCPSCNRYKGKRVLNIED
jgi:large subunit ribosomal protein L32